MRAIPLFLLWLLYFIITSEARNRYMAGKAKGMHCYNSDSHLNYTDYYYNPYKNPEREYLTWREWWQKWGYYQLPKGGNI